jgi:hypothetical protein
LWAVGIRLDIPNELSGGHRCWSDAGNDPRATDESRDALACFKKLLGEQWDGWGRGVPLARNFFMSFQGLESEGVKFYRMIRTLAGVRGLREIVKSLARDARSEYAAATMAMEFCSRIRAAGGEVEFVQRQSTPTPDVRVRLCERWVTMEFKALHERHELEVWYDFEQYVVTGLAARGLLGNDIAFDRELTDAALADPDGVVEGLAAVAAGNHREYVDLPRGTGRARIAPNNCGACGYPIDQQDELVRLASKLRQKWWKQLASAIGPTLLVVRTEHVLGWPDIASLGRAARRLATALAPCLSRLPMVGGVLVYEEPFLAPTWPAFADASDVRVRRDTSNGCARMMALVPNPAAAVRLTEDELSRFVGPEVVW